ncbi:MAG: cysteine--tRNA ligase [Armatimonadetes bacterium]|nr:cysteine--tRNA ligase [Armatimonadota bacterium]
MPVSFFNTMTRAVEPFVPIEEGVVRMYTCGPTVYDFAHIGNFRTYAFEDLLRRYLKYRGYRVIQVMNITDIEDKIIKKHLATGRPVDEITAPYIQAFHDDLKTLRIEPAEEYPRATHFVDEMVTIAKGLLAKGYAYRSEDGSIYFNIRKFEGYGALAHFKVDELVAGARVKQDEYEKESASDFALWKAWDPQDGEVFWETELGKGRPGWHLECSAMSMHYLGRHFDIHTGGEDNIFPHHENEIAQSEGYTGEKFVNYWLHSRHLLVEASKMSKSKGNFYTLRQLLEEEGKPWYAIRYLYIGSHYRSQINFTLDGLDAAARTVKNVYDFLERLRDYLHGAGDETPVVREKVARARADFEAAMDDDLNSSRALAALHTLRGEANEWIAAGTLSGADARAIADLFVSLDAVLGLELVDHLKEENPDDWVEAAIQARKDARASKDWARSDEIRAELAAKGILLEDTPQGVRWRRA